MIENGAEGGRTRSSRRAGYGMYSDRSAIASAGWKRRSRRTEGRWMIAKGGKEGRGPRPSKGSSAAR